MQKSGALLVSIVRRPRPEFRIRVAYVLVMGAFGCADDNVQLVPARLVANPSVLDFGSSLVGTTVARKAVISNDGGQAATIRHLKLLGEGASVFSVQSALGLEIAPERQAELTVAFVATARGRYEAELRVIAEASDADLVIPLVGAAFETDPCETVTCNDSPNGCAKGTCVNGACVLVTKTLGEVCTSTLACVVSAACDGLGACKPAAFRDPGTGCNDGNVCTKDDVCTGGIECRGTPIICDRPPETACVGDVLVSHAPAGMCGGTGECSYAKTETRCPNGCDAERLACACGPGQYTCASGCCNWNVTAVGHPANEHGSNFTSLALASDDTPRILYQGEAQRPMQFARYDGSQWTVVPVLAENAQVGVLRLDAAQEPRIAYRPPYYRARMALGSGGAWMPYVVEPDVDLSPTENYSLSMALGQDAQMHVAYNLFDGGDLVYASVGASTQVVVVDRGVRAAGISAAAAPTSNAPRISYYDGVNGDLKFAHREGAEWKIEIVDSIGDVGRYTALAVDPDGVVTIAYYDVTNADLKIARGVPNGSDLTWTFDVVDSAGDVGKHVAIALDSTRAPHIAYHDATNQDLKYAYRSGTKWVTNVVWFAGETGSLPSIAMSSRDQPHMSFFDHGTTTIMYARP